MATFEYNSQRSKLQIPEYGRHIQNMIEHAKTIEDPVARQKTADAIVDLMNQMVPQGRHVEDYKDKLWKHFFRIANYEIDVKPPSGEAPQKGDDDNRIESLPYSQSDIRYRHYGKYVTAMIEKAVEMEDGPVKEGFVHMIAAYMKLAYRNWNRDHYVSDENIASDIKMISKGKLKLAEGKNLDLLGSPGPDQHSSGKGKKKRSKSRRNYKRRKNPKH